MPINRRKFIQYATLSLASTSPVFAQSITASASTSNELQQQVNALVKSHRRAGRVSSNERTAWSVYDFQTQNKFVSINEQTPLQAASMMKLFVALAYFYLHQQAPNKYTYYAETKDLMTKMIVNSSNTATNTLMKRCGGPTNVKRLCQKATGSLFNQLSLVEYIPANGRTYRNRASAHDYSKLLYALWHDRLPSSREIKRIMSLPSGNRMLTSQMPDQLTIYNKTGSTAMLCGDVGIIQTQTGQAYTFIGIIEKNRRTQNYSQWIRSRGDVMREVSELVYGFMQSRHQLLNSLG
ncbi:serine hydrolase [Ostreibacterium oceani]|uniref:beta-lactamase n=1 Tax=Ostreibacterium oceani TaxID=2654998 RepID=A0A6N7EV70_9GAMM|nr:serine hydrolase [Ostreibacterium oceani]MPV85329.1 serine hydrolase [Ostreibacterium oceani]